MHYCIATPEVLHLLKTKQQFFLYLIYVLVRPLLCDVSDWVYIILYFSTAVIWLIYF